MKILMLITGGIAAHKLPSICSLMKTWNHEVHILGTENAYKFVTRDSLLYSAEIIDGTYLAHIRATQWADVVVIVPGSYNTINKVAAGIADNELTSACAAIPKTTRKIVFPAMNTNMWEKEVLQESIQKLLKWGWIVVEPAIGNLACGGTGKGTLRKTGDVVNLILRKKPVFDVIVKQKLIKEHEKVWYRGTTQIPLRGINFDMEKNWVYLDPDEIPTDMDNGTGSSYPISLDHCGIVYSCDDNYFRTEQFV